MITPVDLIRRFISTKLRIKVYVMVISIASRSRVLLYLLLFLLHGHIPEGISVVNGKPAYHYKGIKIEAPRDSIEAYIEIFQDKVYDWGAVPKEGDIVIDIGAYVGMYSIRASQFVKDGGNVIAVEPLPSNIVYLERNTIRIPNVLY